MEETEASPAVYSKFDACEEDEEQDSDFEMQGQALPVVPFDINAVDTSVPPLTSQEYLQQVIAERAKLPRVVTATVPKLKSSCPKANLCDFPDEDIIDSPHKPSLEWQQEQIYNFSQLRLKIERSKESWTTCLARLPKTKVEWFSFLFEKKSNEKIELLQQPYLDIVLQISNEKMDYVIKYLVDWVSERKIPVLVAGTWLYAMLACIEVPICTKLMNKLRNFVHQCRNKRQEMDVSIEENKHELSAINLFICLIGRYFGQLDICDK